MITVLLIGDNAVFQIICFFSQTVLGNDVANRSHYNVRNGADQTTISGAQRPIRQHSNQAEGKGRRLLAETSSFLQVNCQGELAFLPSSPFSIILCEAPGYLFIFVTAVRS